MKGRIARRAMELGGFLVWYCSRLLKYSLETKKGELYT